MSQEKLLFKHNTPTHWCNIKIERQPSGKDKAILDLQTSDNKQYKSPWNNVVKQLTYHPTNIKK